MPFSCCLVPVNAQPMSRLLNASRHPMTESFLGLEDRIVVWRLADAQRWQYFLRYQPGHRHQPEQTDRRAKCSTVHYRTPPFANNNRHSSILTTLANQCRRNFASKRLNTTVVFESRLNVLSVRAAYRTNCRLESPRWMGWQTPRIELPVCKTPKPTLHQNANHRMIVAGMDRGSPPTLPTFGKANFDHAPS